MGWFLTLLELAEDLQPRRFLLELQADGLGAGECEDRKARPGCRRPAGSSAGCRTFSTLFDVSGTQHAVLSLAGRVAGRPATPPSRGVARRYARAVGQRQTAIVGAGG